MLIELNPRVTALANIRRGAEGDLVAAAITGLSGQTCPPPALPVHTDLVAHFPLAWHWNRADSRLADCFQDVPWGEDALMAEMLRPSWPERQRLARVFGAVNHVLGRHAHPLRLAGAPRPVAAPRLADKAMPG